MSTPARQRWGLIAVLVALGVYLFVVVRCAWVGDDSFITLRTLDHAMSGHGLRYNIAERVQAFTHPLWLALLAVPYAVTRDPYGTALGLGVVTSVATAAGLALGIARTPAAGVLAVAALVSSKAVVDYSTSGLENPLTHALVVGFAALFLRERPGPLWALVGLAGLLILSRPDAVLLVGPALVVAGWHSDRDALLRAPAGLLPVVAWAAFAALYYGSVLPNTAYAKLGTGIPRAELHAQAVHYFAWTWHNDPVTLPLLLAGPVAAAVARDARLFALSAGGLLYAGYVWHIGGDFMGGRFFTAPVVLSAVVLARVPWPHPAWPAGAAAGLALASLLGPRAPLRSGPDYQRAPPHEGVVDERGYYWRGAGLWGPGPRPLPSHAFVQDGLEAARSGDPVEVKSVIGFYGYYAGPEHHVIDRLGLTDPLLARMPSRFQRDWRVGHYRRKVPRGYVDSVVQGADNMIADPELRMFYDEVRLVTRAPLLAPGRLGAVLRLQLGLSRPPRLPWRYPGATMRHEPTGGPLSVSRAGLGLFVPAGATDLSVELGPGSWAAVVERDDAVVRQLELGAGPHTLSVGDASLVVLIPARRSTVPRWTFEGAP